MRPIRERFVFRPDPAPPGSSRKSHAPIRPVPAFLAWKLTSLPVTGLTRQTQALEIGGGLFGNLFGRDAAYLRQTADRLHQKRWFVALAAHRNRGEIRAIGLHQQPVGWYDSCRLAYGFGFWKGEYAAKGQVKSKVQRLTRLLLIPSETVHDA